MKVMNTADLRGLLAKIDANIFKTEMCLEELRRDRILVLRHLDEVATYPVLTLPIEITQEIFTQCLPSTAASFSIKKLRSHPLMILLRVCRAWRDIALSTPELWSTLCIHFDTIGPGVFIPQPGAVEAYIDRWLGRAALRPLSLGFRREDADDPLAECIFPMDRLDDLIDRYSSRLQHLELALSQEDICGLRLDTLDFPILQKATFAHVFGPDPDPHNPVNTFRNAPQLHSLCLEGHAEFSYYVLPSLQLTTFEGAITDIELFKVAPNLRTATCFVDYLVSHTLPISPIHHSRLQSLAFVDNFEAPQDILCYLTLPALECLRISEMADTTYPSLHSFLRRSLPPLITLSIRGDNVGFSDWQECLSSVAATVENLELESPSRRIQDSILYLHSCPLFCPERCKISPPLPKLKHLSFLNSTGTNYRRIKYYLKGRFDDNGLVNLQSFRVVWKYDTFLDSIFCAGEESDDITNTLKRFADAGTRIHIGTERKNYLEW
ncbi:F-box domain-containing protein [Mycena venus]|uniref:F-box domain-containing protein n=1 Tax=Mycena venus TaxID=2733690 RepID=A0A8H6Y1R2_9AGAR|nr:F-box domain-containing protein [Mycena venus]